MDPRTWEHAEVLIDWSARIETGDDVVLAVEEDAHELAVAVAEKLGEVGANLLAIYESGEVSRAYMKAHSGDFDAGSHELAMLENADAYLALGGGRNTTAKADVDGETQQAHSRAREAIREARMATDWVKTVHPTRSLAQDAGMSYEEYCAFVYGAVLRDWEDLADEMGELKQILDEGKQVRIERENTDLTMSIDGRTSVNSAASIEFDSHNLPSGEVFTAPYDTEGEVFFDVPMTINARRVRDVWLRFEDGEVVDHAATAGEDSIEEVLNTDEGAKRLGELGIGMNRGIERVTDNILFDEKMAGTIHLALGRAYDACLPEGEDGNESAVHVDLIADMTRESKLMVDGEVIQRNGTFRWEDEFQS